MKRHVLILEKLLIYGYVQTTTPDLTNGGSSGLMTRITKIIARCLKEGNTQNVEVQMIKVNLVSFKSLTR